MSCEISTGCGLHGQNAGIGKKQTINLLKSVGKAWKTKREQTLTLNDRTGKLWLGRCAELAC
jgi:hypothetical protein